MEQRDMNAISAMIGDFSSHLNSVEEKLQLLRERVSILSQTLLKQNDRLNKEISDLKTDVSNVRNENDKLKDVIDHIVLESGNFARKDELMNVQRYMKLFEPLNFMSQEEVIKLVEKMIEDKKHGKINIVEDE
nr:hypothetical protein [uncultured archaeon]